MEQRPILERLLLVNPSTASVIKWAASAVSKKKLFNMFNCLISCRYSARGVAVKNIQNTLAAEAVSRHVALGTIIVLIN